jgi:DNA-binding CsgD family transcriptional regulator
MRDSDQAQLLAFFKAMANESRLQIVGLLAARERSVQELARLLALSEPTVSHHLAVLKEIVLVSVRAEGVVRWHALVPKALAGMNRALLDKKKVAALAPREIDSEERVLATFVDSNGLMTRIPATRSKRLVILGWLVRKFEEDKRYPEARVNETIQRHHWDSATLRRELIGHRMMAREKGVYWRLPESEWRGVDAR